MKHSVIEVESFILRMEIYIANRTRDIPIQFFVTAEEKKMIRKKILLSKTANMGAYLRKMAIDGIIVNTDTTYLRNIFLDAQDRCEREPAGKTCKFHWCCYPGRNEKIQQTQKELQNQKIIKKHCEVYRACRDMVRAEKDAPDKALYRKKHQAEYQLHDVTLKELTALGIHKLPSADKL